MSVATTPDVGRLAQYRPWEHGGLDLRAVLGDLVVAVAGMEDGSVSSLLNCRQAFADLWGLEVEVDELRPVVEELVDSKRAERAGGGFRLSAALLDELESKAAESQEVETRAFREWELAVRRLVPGLPSDEMDLLCSDLREWVHLIIARHGAEAAMMLYPEEDRARRFFDAVDAERFDRLPAREQELKQIRAAVLPLFIKTPTPDQRRFLASLLNTSFYMTVLTIDPAAKQLVRAQLEGHRIYLDTNFLYAILGAAPPDEVYSSRRLIQLSKDLGFELAVTPWTMAELRTSIARSRNAITSQQRFVQPDLADTMLRTAGDKGFNRFFWQTYKDKRTHPKDVFDRLEHFDQELKAYKIVEVTDGCTQIEQQHERVGLYASLLNAERWPYQKEPMVLEHDAKCRLLVERLRGAGNINVSNARYWFLTYDTKLPRFAGKVPDNGDQAPSLPFCVSPSTWVQIIRALTPRTEDFDRTVVDLLTSPFVGYRPAVNSAVVEEVVGRMDHFEDTSPEMALAILTDTAKVLEIEKAVSTQDEATVEEAVRVAYSNKAQEMQEAVAASQRRLTAIEDSMRETETRAAEAARLHSKGADTARRDYERERDAWEAEKLTLEEQLTAVAKDRDRTAASADKTDRRIKTIEQQLESDDRRRAHARRIGSGLLLVAMGLAVALGSWLVVFDSPWGIGAGVIAGISIILVGLRISLGKDWSKELVGLGGLLAAIAAIVVAIITSSK
jgi:hypothetical protein